MLIFISYSHKDRLRAAEVKNILDDAGIESFMAHDDIGVSQVWRLEILKALRRCDAFICLLSENFFASHWCVQETGIASYREDEIGIIPLSLDGTVPQGCFSHIQSTKVRGDKVSWKDLAPGFSTIMPAEALFDLLMEWAGKAWSFRDAEDRLETLTPYLDAMSLEQVERLLELAADNGQIWDASLCIKRYLPAVVKRYDDLNAFDPDTEAAEFIREKISDYYSFGNL